MAEAGDGEQERYAPAMQRALVPCSLVILASTLFAPAAAEASELRYSNTVKGGIVSTGNTLGLAKELNANGPGTRDSIGTFLTLDNQLVDNNPANVNNPWGPGTTGDWTLDGSAAVLELPMASGAAVEVLYAELIWGGSYLYGTEDVSGSLEVPVTLAAEGDELDVAPDPQTRVTLMELSNSNFAVNYYMRSADVTDFVADHMATTYSVSGVPATQDVAINSLNAAGWTLVVVYRAANAPTRNLTVFVGGQFVDEDAIEDYPVSGFCTPPQGTVTGAAVISAIEGDANLTGDIFQIAPTVQGPFAPLSGPNNPQNNFFCSQLNASDGNLDTQGTAGTSNHDAFAGVNVSGARQGWDITKLGLSSAQGQLSPGQTSAVLRAVTTGDSFMPVLAAFEIDVSSPDFETGSVSAIEPSSVDVGEQATLSFEIANEGEVTASGLDFTAPLGAGLELVSFAIDGVEGDATQQPVTKAGLETGVNLGVVPAGGAMEVTIVVEASGPPPAGNAWQIVGQWTYSYVSCVGEDPLSEQSQEFLQLAFEGDGTETGDGDGDSGDGDGDGDTSADTTSDDGTDGGTDGTTGITGPGFDDFGGRPGEEGCNCATGTRSRPWGIGLIALVLLAGVRRREDDERR